MEKVSIIIPFYNCPYVDQAIRSALNQTYKNIEIIVINDGSSKHEAKIKPFLTKINYYKKSNGGTASALNTGIKAASGDYFCWLSSDDVYEPTKVEKQLAFMKKQQATISYSSFITINEHSSQTSGALGIQFPYRTMFYRTLKRGCPINGCTVMMKMSVFKEVGLFNEDYPFAHDYELWLRVVQKYDFHFLNEPLVKYRVHNDMGSKKHAELIANEVNEIKTKHTKALEQLIRKGRK